jgi:Zn-dependent protease with chaperone function
LFTVGTKLMRIWKVVRVLTFSMLGLTTLSTAQVPAHLVQQDSGLSVHFGNTYKLQKSKLPELPNSQKKIVLERFTDRFNEQMALVKRGDILYYSDLQSLVQLVFDEIIVKNKLSSDFRVFVTGEVMVNAYTSGDGNIFITVGLLERIKHIDELKFVICHELSHQLQNHVNLSIMDVAQWSTDRQMKRDFERENRNNYQKSKLKEGYIISKIADSRKHSRIAEYEADSIGLSLFENVGGNKDLAYALLERLDLSDYELYNDKINIGQLLEEIGIEPEASWLPRKATSSLGFDKYERYVVEEKFKTHPDIPLRIAALKGDTTVKVSENYAKITEEYERIQSLAELEAIRFWYFNDNIGRGFFRAMILDQKQPMVSLKEVALLSFARLALARKQKQFGNYVSQENIMWDENYNECLHFLNELGTQDLLRITEQYKKTHFKDETETTAVCDILVKLAEGELDSVEKLNLDYMLKYPKGVYRNYLKELINNKL